jgi:SAM-dependent methyltransferase
MVACAPHDPQIEYIVSPAEKLPLEEDAFDLITVSSALHWLDHSAFFAEACRVLRPPAWLIIYDNYFLGQMEENTAYQAWSQDHLLKKYPIPPRTHFDFAAENLETAGFHLVHQEGYQNRVEFSIAALVDYLVTQSNVIAAVEGQGQDIEGVRTWLSRGVAPFFGNRPTASFLFGGSIWYLRPAQCHKPRHHSA